MVVAVSPIQILMKLMPMRQRIFEFKPIKIEDAYRVINNAKATKLSGYDGITMKTLKQIPYFTALTITHLVNNIIFTKKFPDCLKVSQIVPISKKENH